MNATNESALADRKCVSCSGKTPPLGHERVCELLQQVPGWRLSDDGKRLIRDWRVDDFLTGLDFFRRVGDVAEAEDHHPELHLANYRDVRIELWTHTAGGLTVNDFILAAKINELSIRKDEG
jgi:4a-hydroxytetrahydrobiopterin dehydratase